MADFAPYHCPTRPQYGGLSRCWIAPAAAWPYGPIPGQVGVLTVAMMTALPLIELPFLFDTAGYSLTQRYQAEHGLMTTEDIHASLLGDFAEAEGLLSRWAGVPVLAITESLATATLRAFSPLRLERTTSSGEKPEDFLGTRLQLVPIGTQLRLWMGELPVLTDLLPTSPGPSGGVSSGGGGGNINHATADYDASDYDATDHYAR